MGVIALYCFRFNGSICGFRGRAAFRAAGFFFAVFAARTAAFGLATTRADFLFGFVFFFAVLAMLFLSCDATLAYQRWLRTHILSRNVVA